MGKLEKSVLIISLIILLDQALKIWVKTHMILGQQFCVIGHWFYIHFTENNGMAFGLEFGGDFGKILLTLFRIVAITGIGWYLVRLCQKNASMGLIISISMIFAGALGNLIDSVFYGIIFDDSYYQVATILPEGGGYSSFLHGRVVDMLYFPLIQGHFPTWVPFVGEDPFIFFRPVFNIADSSITTGVSLILLFQKIFFRYENVNRVY
jgi:signal peptidase II